MFRNVNVEFGTDQSLLMRWEWLDNEDRSVPGCNVFCCSVPENKLLEKGMFLESEIFAYFNENVVKITSPDVKNEFKAYQQRYPEACRLNYFQRGNNDKENRMLPIPPNTQNHIFLVCVYDEKDIDFKIVSCEREKKIEFEIVKPTFMEKLKTNFVKAERRQAVKLKCNDQRKKVVLYKSGRDELYAVLPENADVYYFDESVDLSGIKIYYLSSLIGKSEMTAN